MIFFLSVVVFDNSSMHLIFSDFFLLPLVSCIRHAFHELMCTFHNLKLRGTTLFLLPFSIPPFYSFMLQIF